MYLTVRECLTLPSLRLGKVAAGEKGLDAIVNTVSVLEFDDRNDEIFVPNDLCITAFYSVRKDVEAQCRLLKRFKRMGCAGVILFYTDVILQRIDQKVIEVGNQLNLPIIVLPGGDMGLKYSDVITDVMNAVFLKRTNQQFFAEQMMQRIAALSAEHRNIECVLSLLSDYARAAFILCDGKLGVIASSFWPQGNVFSLDQIIAEYCMRKDKLSFQGSRGIYYRQSFTGNNGNELILLAVSQYDPLSMQVLSDAISVIRLFSATWNHNLDTYSREFLIPAVLKGDRRLAVQIAEKQRLPLEKYRTVLFITGSDRTALPLLRKKFESLDQDVIVDVLGEHTVSFFTVEEEYLLEYFSCEDILSAGSGAVFSVSQSGDISAEYKLYCNYFTCAKKIYPQEKLLNAEQLAFAKRVGDMQYTEEGTHYLRLISPIQDSPEENLVLTLSVHLLDAGGQIKKTAELLHTHRNTVLYRLNKMKKLLGKDFETMPFLFEIYQAAALLRLA
ncbi:PucR family transcriptional regulator [Ihubacter sp. mB4P-1]|uniref:PucR family transcriptional regulator n=1 Tax=Ihubacter sp. mB4P-1 TaxID=3242370 RepID=UPI003C7B7FED